ncbi:DUF2750 domain-containing protein [Mucilaginibacter phyllosphaerae]|uniref:DUF2750 domain-containing protein n=1 Tax=Mucilaginibacter phyllosphaerae TaxID=1812349 RepID=A0A4Y8AJV7_9SPHI|nr:DUF2750 domain-containing protein [Mucilaginibacter phyllosphaerae]MBB3967652.1 hypothetical protein [Mucilaginibacter phyllosphaerae]TEW69293.1 DUF2750 domain-containing protein [Mucilaginibacter phyllosphaerae]GGH04210.1 hypothetical protein GCM10007352_07270 [Mucilaginibacter phyllosphaerae]
MAEELEAKYIAFVEKVAASKQVWGLKSKTGWANAEAAENNDVAVIPFWSDRSLAKICARDDWKTYTPTEIPLAIFLEDLCIDMAGNEVLAGINWDARMFGTEADALVVALDILNRLAEINSAITFTGYSSINEFITEISEEE